MRYRTLGKTGLEVSALSFGGGPISTLMVGDQNDLQRAVIQAAIERGINWFDTAATYGAGQSERNLGRVLEELNVADRVHVATKVRLTSDDLGDIRGAVRRSFEASLVRLRLPGVTLLQLHNSITPRRGDEPTSITPADVLGPGGVLQAFAELRAAGLVRHLGLTGIGNPASLGEVIRSGEFDSMQAPYHLLNPSAGREMSADFAETNYGDIIGQCAEAHMGVLAIRVFAGGALVDKPPSPHTLTTPFFPLSLYERDRERARRLQEQWGPQRRLSQETIRFVLAHRQVSTALIGFGAVQEIEEAIEALESVTPPPDWDDAFTTPRRVESGV